jgi:hypothetical protein
MTKNDNLRTHPFELKADYLNYYLLCPTVQVQYTFT